MAITDKMFLDNKPVATVPDIYDGIGNYDLTYIQPLIIRVTNLEAQVALLAGRVGSLELLSATFITANQTTMPFLATVGTITSGTWNGTLISGQYGGTGVNNSGKTITLGGNLTTSGANALTFTTTGDTNVTLPTSGTLVTASSLGSAASASTSDFAPFNIMPYGGMNFDGTTDYLDGNTLSGIVDSKVGTFFATVSFSGLASGTENIVAATGDRFVVQRTSSGFIRVLLADSSGTNIFTAVSTTVIGGGLHHILVSYDLAAGLYKIYVNDQDHTPVATTLTNATIDYTTTEWAIGASTVGNNKFSGTMYSVFFDAATYMDLSVAANRKKFWSDNIHRYLGDFGELPTAKHPVLFLGYDEDPTIWIENKGFSMTRFTNNGTLDAATASISGEYAPIAQNRKYFFQGYKTTTATGNGTRLSCDQLIGRRGEAYDPTTGIWTCPRPGEYEIEMTGTWVSAAGLVGFRRNGTSSVNRAPVGGTSYPTSYTVKFTCAKNDTLDIYQNTSAIKTDNAQFVIFREL